MTGLRYLSNVVTLRLDETQCTGCGMCEMVCPHAVFRIERHGQVRFGEIFTEPFD